LIAEEGAVIEDLGSRNGVFVNAVRVDRHVLEESDLVTVGDTQFRFESDHSNQGLKT
jgi:pSer/pThr/pTyr-binding forkhead associated (FHA) protein